MAQNWESRNATSRTQRAARINVRMVSYVDKVVKNTKLKVDARLKMTGQMLRDIVVFNISRPVRKMRVKVRRVSQGSIVTSTVTMVDPKSRSKMGEFPKADTTRLMKDIFWDFDANQMVVKVGSTLDYAIYLELRMHRSFLRRSFNSTLSLIKLLFTEKPSGFQIALALGEAAVQASPEADFSLYEN